jgi:hypothetical protein
MRGVCSNRATTAAQRCSQMYVGTSTQVVVQRLQVTVFKQQVRGYPAALQPVLTRNQAHSADSNARRPRT